MTIRMPSRCRMLQVRSGGQLVETVRMTMTVVSNYPALQHDTPFPLQIKTSGKNFASLDAQVRV